VVKKLSIELPVGKKKSWQLELSTVQPEKKNPYHTNSSEGVESKGSSHSKDDKKIKNRILLKHIVFGGEIGRGKFGKVLLGSLKDGNRDDHFAVKILKKKEVFSMINRVKEEITSLTSLYSPFIVKFYGVLEDDHKLYILQEYVDGGNLQNFMNNRGRISEEITRHLFIEIYFGLCDVHKNMIVFRDLSLENILVTTTGHVKLCDFGLSKKLKKGQLTGTSCGTRHFEAPEIVFRSGHDITADYWSLGIVLYEMLNGKSPFINMDEKEVTEILSKNKIPIPEGISDDAINLIFLLLEKDRAKRKRNFSSIRSHPWFKNINWSQYEQRSIPAPYEVEKFVPNPEQEHDNGTVYPLTDIEIKMYNVLSQECKIDKGN
jgi:serine/threonine protein kinase